MKYFGAILEKKAIRCVRRINLFLLSRFYFLLNTIIIIPAITITAVTINIKNNGGSPGTGAGVGAGVGAVEGGVMVGTGVAGAGVTATPSTAVCFFVGVGVVGV